MIIELISQNKYLFHDFIHSFVTCDVTRTTKSKTSQPAIQKCHNITFHLYMPSNNFSLHKYCRYIDSMVDDIEMIKQSQVVFHSNTTALCEWRKISPKYSLNQSSAQCDTKNSSNRIWFFFFKIMSRICGHSDFFSEWCVIALC